MFHDFVVVFENEVAEKSQAALVEGNHGWHVGTAKLLRSPQDGSVASERNYKINFASALFVPVFYRMKHFG